MVWTRTRLFQLAQLLRLAHGNQKITGFDAIVGRGVEAHARLAFDGKDDDATVLANARIFDGLTGKRTARSDWHFTDLEIHAEMGGGGVEEADHVRTQEGMGDPLSGKNIRRHDRIGARAAQVLLRPVFTGAGNDAQLWIQTAGGKHDIEVGGVGGGGSHQAAGALDLGVAQSLFLGGVTDEHEPVLAGEFLRLGLVAFNDHELSGPAGQLAGRTAADASGAADDVVTGETTYVTLHAAPSKEVLQLEF